MMNFTDAFGCYTHLVMIQKEGVVRADLVALTDALGKFLVEEVNRQTTDPAPAPAPSPTTPAPYTPDTNAP